MRQIYFLLFTSIYSITFGQKLEWVKSLDFVQDFDIKPIKISQDRNGNFLFFGNTYGKLDLDPSSNTHIIGNKDTNSFFLTKWTEDGTYLWSISASNFSLEFLNDLHIDKKDNIYFSTLKREPYSIYFKNDTIKISDSLQGSVFYKIDSNGNLLWSYKFKPDIRAFIMECKTNSKNEVIVGGTFLDSIVIDFKNSIGEKKYYNRNKPTNFLMKLSESGNPVWFRQFNCNPEYYISSNMEIDIFDNIYYNSEYADSIDLTQIKANEIIKPKKGGKGILVLKLNNDGVYRYAKSIDDNEGLVFHSSIKLDKFGNLYLKFENDGWVDVDPSENEVIFKLDYKNSRLRSVIVKWDQNGNYVWSKDFDQQYLDFCKKDILWVDDEVSFFVIYKDEIKLDLTNKNNFYVPKDTWGLLMVTYNLEGNLSRAFQIRIQNNTYPRNIFRDIKKNIFIGVRYYGSLDFDPTYNSQFYGIPSLYPENFSLAKYSAEILNSDSLDKGKASLNPNFNNNFSISFQNPINNYLDLKLDKTKVYELIIYDLNGRKLVEKHVIKKATAQLDLSSFASGIYILNCQSDEQSQSYKIEKE